MTRIHRLVRPGRSAWATAGIAIAFGTLLAAAGSGQAASLESCGSANEIVCENARPGADPADWQINDAGDPSIQGFATQISVGPGRDRPLQDRH